MGEIADDHIDQMLFGGWGFPRPRSKWRMTCNRCGMRGLKWRMTDAGWRLFEKDRIENNQLKPHECNPPSADDFDVVSDD